MLSYITDMTIENNRYELGWERLVNLEIEGNFIGKEALRKIQKTGVSQLFVGVEIDGEPLAHPNGQHWPVFNGESHIGRIRSAVYSPRLKQNIGLAMMQIDHTEIDTQAVAQTPFGPRNITVVPKPFYDPDKKLAPT